ncbi:MAG: MarR family transcriptional regulator [Bacteroidaceae bacterium]|nr:MarR family transcriptional regulator [Bacteroidaceae bacterium]
MTPKKHIAVVGAANVDIMATPKVKYVPCDSRPGRIDIAYGGVGRNIAHNLTLMGCRTSLVTVFGDDIFAAGLKDNCREIGIDTTWATTVAGGCSSIFTCINDEQGEMMSAVSAMDILDGITPELLRPHIDSLNACDAVAMDANLPTETIAYLLQNCSAPLFADTVSATKSRRLFDALDGTHRLHTLKMNRIEAQTLTDLALGDIPSLESAARLLHALGVERVCITLGAQGVYYHDAEGGRLVPCEQVPVVSTTGAGDAFVAGLVLAFVNGLDTTQTIQCAQRASALAVQSASAVNPQINEHYVLNN